MFPRYLQYLLTDFRQTFVTGASWDTDDLITFLGQKVKAQGHTIAAEAHSTRCYRGVQLFLVSNLLQVILHVKGRIHGDCCNFFQSEAISIIPRHLANSIKVLISIVAKTNGRVRVSIRKKINTFSNLYFLA